MNHAEYEKWVNSHSGWGSELEADGGCSAEDAVGDFVDGYVRFPKAYNSVEAIEYLKRSGVKDIRGRLADDFFDIAYVEKE